MKVSENRRKSLKVELNNTKNEVFFKNIRENHRTRHIFVKSGENYVQRCRFAGPARYLRLSGEIIGKFTTNQPE